MGTSQYSPRITVQCPALCWSNSSPPWLYIFGLEYGIQCHDEFCSVCFPALIIQVVGNDPILMQLRTINNFAFLVPILTNVLLRRRTMHRGPFFMGQTIGMTVNIVSVAWLVFAIVFFSFPYQMPATGMYCDFVVGVVLWCRLTKAFSIEHELYLCGSWWIPVD